MNCTGCGCPVKGNYAKCWKCQQKEKVTQAYELGYQQGLLVGEKNGPPARQLPGITLERWRQLMQLCHPDKHNGSKTAVDVAVWLQEVKPE